MTFKPALWHPIALGLSALNLVGVGLAAGAAEPWHAGIHAALGVAFWSWAQRLRQPVPAARDSEHYDALELEVGQLRRELMEAEERLDFTERMLAQGRETRRPDVEQ